MGGNKFLMFDVKNFYTSIKEKLLWEAIRFARRYISITSMDIDAILMQGNTFYITTTNRGSKKGKATLMLQWTHTMVPKYVN